MNKVVKLICLMLVLIMGNVQAQVVTDPVVISYGDIQVNRRQFEHEFEMAMVMKALETGIPIKNQDQISVMEHRFLEQRAKEMVLLGLAEERGLKVSVQRLDEILNEYMQYIGFSEYNEKNLYRLGFSDEVEFRNILKDKQIISLLLSEINNDLDPNTDQETVTRKIQEYYNNSGIRIYPENIDIP